MSLSDRARALLALSTVLGVSGCFQPMYGEASHPGLAEAMKEVEVLPVSGRVGHYLADDLITQLNGTGESRPPKYRLQIIVGQGRTTPIVESQIGVATSATVSETATMILTEIATGKEIYRGQAVAIAPYDRSFNDYANLRADRDADLRVARSLADEIAQRVGAAVASKS
jgi:LPS-assembly lipoprotein